MNSAPPTKNIVLPGMKGKRAENAEELEEDRRLTGLGWMSKTMRGHFVAWLGELVGTFMFLFFAFAATKVANQTTQAQTGAATATQAANTSNLLYIALAFGFSLAVNAWVFFRITGGLFNPAVTVGMMMIRAVGVVRGIVVMTAQIIGAIAAAAVVLVLFPGELGVLTTLSPSTSIVRGLFIEMFCTAELVFCIFMLAAEKSEATFIAPVGIGLSLFIAELSAVFFTGGSLNPARSFGPAVATHSFVGYHWIYWLGPFLGTVLAVLFYKLVKALEYETDNANAKPLKVQEEEQDRKERHERDQGQYSGDSNRSGTESDMTAVKYQPRTQAPSSGNVINYNTRPAVPDSYEMQPTSHSSAINYSERPVVNNIYETQPATYSTPINYNERPAVNPVYTEITQPTLEHATIATVQQTLAAERF